MYKLFVLSTLTRSYGLVQATLMEDKEVKVVVEESFKSSTLLDKGSLASSNEHSNASASTDSAPNWTVKVEQSINIFLTVHYPDCQLCLCDCFKILVLHI